MIQNRRSSSVTHEQLQMIHQAIFGRYDVDQNGFLQENEVKTFMKQALVAGGNTQQEAQKATKKFYDQVDKNGDGKISKQQMMQIMKFILEQKLNQAARSKKKT